MNDTMSCVSIFNFYQHCVCVCACMHACVYIMCVVCMDACLRSCVLACVPTAGLFSAPTPAIIGEPSDFEVFADDHGDIVFNCSSINTDGQIEWSFKGDHFGALWTQLSSIKSKAMQGEDTLTFFANTTISIKAVLVSIGVRLVLQVWAQVVSRQARLSLISKLSDFAARK